MDTLGEGGTYQYLVDYWVEQRANVDAPLTGWGPEFEEEDKNIKKARHEEEFVSMITTSLKTI